MRTICAFLIGTLFFLQARGRSQNAPSKAIDGQSVIQFLNETIDWHRHLAAENEAASGPADVLILSDNRETGNRVVQLAFEFSRAAAQQMGKQGSQEQPDTQAVTSHSALLQLSNKLDGQIQETQSELQSLRQKLETATGSKRRALQAQIAETQSEVELAQVRRDSVRSIVEFATGASTSGLGATGLRGQVEELARSLPPELSKSSTNDSNNPATSHPQVVPELNQVQRSGIWGLTAELFSLAHKREVLLGLIRQTDALSQSCKQLRGPLVERLKQLSSQGDDLAKQADTAAPDALAQEKQSLDQLTTQFKQIAAVALPLSKQNMLLALYKTSLTNWRSSIANSYREVLKSLIVRLVLLGVALAAILGLGELVRKTIFRYVHDTRRRYQFLLLRKILLWILIAIVIAIAFASQIGSVATFAGLLTAGVAVALQNVLLSMVGYFFLIGKFGIRVGDRVQIAGVTGEVIDIGLVRIHVMETGPGGATGRVVGFSNAIVFQAAGLFKQIPGTSFGWHEIALTLSPDSEYHAVEERLRSVVEKIFAEHKDELERQRRLMERTLDSTPIAELRPRSRLRFTSTGLEAVIRFPVELGNASEMDDQVTRELLKALYEDPKMKVAGTGIPGIRLRTDLASEDASAH